jgi:HK97 family phage major capsid protein
MEWRFFLMKTITEMREEIVRLMKELGDMKAQMIAENRSPNDTEREKAAGLLDAVKELEDNIEMEERIEETEKRLAQPKEEPTKPDVKKTTITKEERKKKDQFLTFGEQLQAIIHAGNNRGTDPRLTRAISGLNETVQSEGGFFVQQDFAGNLMRPIFETGRIASRLNRMSLSGNSNGLKIPGIDESSRATGSRWGGIQMYWIEEAGTLTKSKPKFRMINLQLNKLAGLAYLTDELIQDASALESYVETAFREELEFMIDDSVIRGTGAGRPLGILNSGCLVSQGKETGQNADTIVYNNILNMWSKLIATSRTNAVWLINQNVEPQLAQMHLDVGTGAAPVFLPPGGATASPYSTIFGRPVIPMEQCSSLGDKGDIFLADFSKYYFIDKGTRQDYSIHVRFLNDEQVFRIIYRCDGQPMLGKAITPYKGASGETHSHFVTLNARA